MIAESERLTTSRTSITAGGSGTSNTNSMASAARGTIMPRFWFNRRRMGLDVMAVMGAGQLSVVRGQ